MDSNTVKVWRLDWPSAAIKLVALAIARRARENGACWASQKTLADDTGLSRKTVQRAVLDMESMDPPRVKRRERYREDGSRSSDFIWLILPAITLEAVTMSPKQELADIAQHDADMGQDAPPLDTVTGGPRSQSPGGVVTVSSQKDSLKDSLEEDARDGFDSKTAAEMLWKRVGDMGRKRSRKDKVEKALIAAVERRPKGETIETRILRIVSGIDGYLRSPDVKRDDGAFERGLHRSLEGDAWEEFETSTKALDPSINPDMGTSANPGPAMQRLWAQLAREGMPWSADDRGPRPGMPGCRIADEIQREFGFIPWAQPGQVIEETIVDVTHARPALPSPAHADADIDPDAGAFD